MSDRIPSILERNLSGEAVGLWSICSAHPAVVRAAIGLAHRCGQVALVEGTCNQFNQDGGYTGLRPADFARAVRSTAADAGFPPDRLVLGGDHLGPQPWRHLPAAKAMEKAEAMVAAYVRAGFTKIHLDCSMRCADDPEVLPENLVAGRAARLAAVAEAASGDEPLFYVIGTEVPAPGGMGIGHGIEVTPPERVADTWEAHRAAFAAAGLDAAFNRVAAVVVQPGLDFGNETVVNFDPGPAAPLSQAAARLGGAVFEAHSTDFQRSDAYTALLAGHFAILKVGPAATFAMREALYALEAIEAELLAEEARSGLRSALEAAMIAAPGYWQSHYDGDADRQRLLRHFSYSDRIRYYWSDPGVVAALRRLESCIAGSGLPLTLVSQYLPQHVSACREGRVASTLPAIVAAAVETALVPYAAACGRHIQTGAD